MAKIAPLTIAVESAMSRRTRRRTKAKRNRLVRATYRLKAKRWNLLSAHLALNIFEFWPAVGTPVEISVCTPPGWRAVAGSSAEAGLTPY